MPTVMMYSAKNGKGIYVLPSLYDDVANQKRIDEIESQNEKEN